MCNGVFIPVADAGSKSMTHACLRKGDLSLQRCRNRISLNYSKTNNTKEASTDVLPKSTINSGLLLIKKIGYEDYSLSNLETYCLCLCQVKIFFLKSAEQHNQ